MLLCQACLDFLCSVVNFEGLLGGGHPTVCSLLTIVLRIDRPWWGVLALRSAVASVCVVPGLSRDW